MYAGRSLKRQRQQKVFVKFIYKVIASAEQYMHMTTINLDLFLSQLMNIFSDTCRFEICHLVKKLHEIQCVYIYRK